MKTLLAIAAPAAIALTFAVPAAAQEQVSQDIGEVGGKATFLNLKGEEIGTATLRSTPSGSVLIQAEVRGLEPGERGFHIHETGKCDPATEFKSADGHLAGDKKHGFVEGGPHPGDMPNQHVPANGVLLVDAFNDRVSLSDNGEGALFDADGSAIMIHSGADDYTSQPSGAAGSRVACAVIEKVE